MTTIKSVKLKVGMEVHVELATRSKMFTRAGNGAHPEFDGAEPNTLIDPVVLALPGALPVMNRAAVEMAMMVGMALGCSIASRTKWDRKSYFYPDLPKSYQISQYDLPLCFDGIVSVPRIDEKGMIAEGEPRQIGIIRAHLEEDAGKLLHEAPGGHAIDYSIVDWNRAGTPLLEIVTQPDFDEVWQVVSFAKMLRNICRFLGVTEGVMQKGHMRFEPNINTVLTLEDGRIVATPVVEIKNLNSFKALEGAVRYELAEQPRRWERDGREMGRGAKRTFGWDDQRGVTVMQREKEDADDYRYFPDPDLVPVVVSESWREEVKARIPELPLARQKRYAEEYGLGVKEAAALVAERDDCFFYEMCVADMVKLGFDSPRAGKVAANYVLQNGAKRANERGGLVCDLGIRPFEVAQIAKLKEEGRIGAGAADELFGLLADGGKVEGIGTEPPPSPKAATPPPTGEDGRRDVEALARERGLLIVRDDAAMERWVDEVIARNEKVAADVRGGKVQAVGRLVGEVMKLAGGAADAKGVREAILKRLGVG